MELGGDGIRVNALLPGIVAGKRQQRVLQAKAQARGRQPARPADLGAGAVGVRRYRDAWVRPAGVSSLEKTLEEELEAGVGIEPAYTDLQSAAWPLCHPATTIQSAFRLNRSVNPSNQKGKLISLP